MSKVLLAKSMVEDKNPLTKLLRDILSTYANYLMDDISYPVIMDHLHSLDTTILPFNVDSVFEHMCHLKEDMIDEYNK